MEDPAFHAVDSSIFLFSRSANNHFDSLIPFVNKTFASNKEKVRALYTWIASNISYDKDLLDSYKLKSPLDLKDFSSLTTQHPDTVLKYRKAVCEGFCLLMNKCCERLSIVSEMVIGVTKMNDIITDDILHAWNAIKLDTTWHLLDITWSNGYVDQSNHYVKRFTGNYFFSPPSAFVQNHWPLDAMWQLNEYPIPKNSFYKSVPDTHLVFFNYRDSITSYLKLKRDTLEYVTFWHYHLWDPQNDAYKRECDRIVHDKLVVYLNLAAAGFEDYQRYVQKYNGRPLSVKVLQQFIDLLQTTENYLAMGLNYSRHKTFFHAEIWENFNKMTKESGINLKKVQGSILAYRKLIKTMQANKK